MCREDSGWDRSFVARGLVLEHDFDYALSKGAPAFVEKLSNRFPHAVEKDLHPCCGQKHGNRKKQTCRRNVRECGNYHRPSNKHSTRSDTCDRDVQVNRNAALLNCPAQSKDRAHTKEVYRTASTKNRTASATRCKKTTLFTEDTDTMEMIGQMRTLPF